MDEFYKSYYLHTLVDLSLDTDCWVPKVEVIWEEQGVPRRQQLVGPNDLFKILEDAETYAIEMARGWIDDQPIKRRNAITNLETICSHRLPLKKDGKGTVDAAGSRPPWNRDDEQGQETKGKERGA